MQATFWNAPVRAVVLGALLLLSSALSAQEWPNKPVRIIVPFPPGQGADIIGRLVAERLTVALGQQVLVENRPGAGSMAGTAYAAKTPADGYTFLIGGTSAMVINPHLYSKLEYTLQDFAPITNIASLPMVICVTPSLPVQSIQDLIKLANQRPNELAYGSSGNGSSHHLVQALFAATAEIQIVHVPYKGSVASMTDLVGGRISMLADTLPAVLPHVRSGKVRAIGITSSKRSFFYPELPTLDEQGLPGFEATAWAGFFAPAGTPTPILQRLNNEVVNALKTPEMQKRFQDLAMPTIGDTRADFEVFLNSEYARWGKAVRLSGAKID
jgi:tripartite-type tricarboxylate transporter receptor subunit TctC